MLPRTPTQEDAQARARARTVGTQGTPGAGAASSRSPIAKTYAFHFPFMFPWVCEGGPGPAGCAAG